MFFRSVVLFEHCLFFFTQDGDIDAIHHRARVKAEVYEVAPSRRGRDKKGRGGVLSKSFKGKREWPFAATRQAKRARHRMSEGKMIE